MVERVLQSLRGYFLGVTLVAVFNAAVVGGGALILGVPLAGTIAAVTFVGAYVPYLGAWGAGVFSVLIVTIAGGALFGAVGLILAAPLTAAATRIAADLARDRAEAARPPAPGPEASAVS